MKKIHKDAKSFVDFIEEWSKVQYKAPPPSIHQEIAHWLEEKIHQHNQMCILAFRGSGKSTVIGLFVIWMLIHDPNMRIIIMSAEQSLCNKMVDFTKQVIENHPWAQHLKPEKKSNWSKSSLTVQRDIVIRDPSIISKSISSNYTGCRAEMVVFDDIEVPKTCNTPAKRNALREKINDMEYVLIGQKYVIHIGTPHHYDSLYYGPRALIRNYAIKKIPLLDDRGKLIWSDFITPEKLSQMMCHMYFASQMMLEPKKHKGKLKIENIQFYSQEIQPICINHANILGKKIKQSAVWMDVAYGMHKSNDNTVIALMLHDQNNKFYIHDISYIRVSSNNTDDDNINYIGHHVIQFMKLYDIQTIYIESNGVGKFMPSTIRRLSKFAQYPIQIMPIHQSDNKNWRISTAMEWALSSRNLCMHTRLQSSPLMNELKYWSPDELEHDDGIDAVSSYIMYRCKQLGMIDNIC